jgi:hypothetical protein
MPRQSGLLCRNGRYCLNVRVIMNGLYLRIAASLCVIVCVVACTPAASDQVNISPDGTDPAKFFLACHDVPAYDVFVAIAKYRKYEIRFDQRAEAICRKTKVGGLFHQPWEGGGTDIEQVAQMIVTVATDRASLPPGDRLKFVEPTKGDPVAKVIVVNKSRPSQ